jgi:hypothetical protein
MEEGFLPEKGDGPLLSPETWVAGKPTESFMSGVSLKNRVIHEVVTFRCKACGYLESYALRTP